MMGLVAGFPVGAFAAPTLVPELPPVAQLTPGNGTPIEVRTLDRPR